MAGHRSHAGHFASRRGLQYQVHIHRKGNRPIDREGTNSQGPKYPDEANRAAYEILVRHERDFESSYGIVDLTPNLPAGEVRRLMTEGNLVEDGGELYDIRNGGFLHFRLSQASKLVDPRAYMPEEFDSTMNAARRTSQT